MLKTLFTFIFALLLASPLASADIENLLNSPTRPTIADIKREMKGQEISLDRTEDYQRLDDILSATAHLIAELEWAYPGAIYMPLGRDVVLIGDVVDAFYHAYGQPERVKRLNASGQSLRKQSGEMIARFVQSSGVDIKNLTKGPSYIFFDGSNYSLPDKSQSTLILSSVYDAYLRQGGQAKDLVDKFAFFNLASMESGIKVMPGLDREKFLQDQRTYLENNPRAIPNKTFAAYKQAYGVSEWHANFNPLKEMPDGSVIAPAPEPHPLDMRKNILQTMQKIMTAVAQPKFLEEVSRRAKLLGYEFPIRACDQSLKD